MILEGEVMKGVFLGSYEGSFFWGVMKEFFLGSYEGELFWEVMKGSYNVPNVYTMRLMAL